MRENINRNVVHSWLQVSAWRSRGVVLPVAVDSTAALVELRLMDPADFTCRGITNAPEEVIDNPNSLLSSQALKLLYGSTITRLVNGILDVNQVSVYHVPLIVRILRQANYEHNYFFRE